MKNGTSQAVALGEHIVADPGICHGKPTFKGSRILVKQVLEDVADGKSWDFISQVRWGGRLAGVKTFLEIAFWLLSPNP